MLSLGALSLKIVSMIIGLLAISFIVVFHELGHFIFCKLFKVHTPTFSIGIGKILFSKKIGDTNFCISAGPIGGYVEVASEDGENNTKGFNNIAYYQKVLIMLGGISFNFILSYFIFVGLFFTGMPENATGPYEPATCTVASIAPESINSHILMPQDQIIALDFTPLNDNMATARTIIAQKVNNNISSIHALINRQGSLIETMLMLKGESQPNSFNKQLEISMSKKPGLGFSDSCKWAAQSLKFYLGAIISGLKDMIYAKNVKGFVGPVMAVAASGKSAQKGFDALMFLVAIISLNLGFMNLLPLPIFDGGQFVIFTTEAIIGHQLSEKVRHWIAMSSWILAIGLLIIFTIRDLYVLMLH